VETVIINVIAVEFKVKVYLWDVILFKPDLLESLFYLFLRCQLGYPVRAHHLSFVFVSVEQGRDWLKALKLAEGLAWGYIVLRYRWFLFCYCALRRETCLNFARWTPEWGL